MYKRQLAVAEHVGDGVGGVVAVANLVRPQVDDPLTSVINTELSLALGDGRPRDRPAKTLKFLALVRLTGHA